MRFQGSFVVTAVLATLGMGGLAVLHASCSGGPAAPSSPPSTSACPPSSLGGEPSSPIDYAERDLATAQATAKSTAPVRVVTADDPAAGPALTVLDERPESYAIVNDGASGALVVGRDTVGAMYGTFELAERLRLRGASAIPLAAPITGAPAISYRAYNPYIVMQRPWRSVLVLPRRVLLARLPRRDGARADELPRPPRDVRPRHLALSEPAHVVRDQQVVSRREPAAERRPVGRAARERAGRERADARDDRSDGQGARHPCRTSRGALDLGIDIKDTSDRAVPFGPADAASTQTDLETYTREAVTNLLQSVPDLAAIGVRVGEGAARRR